MGDRIGHLKILLFSVMASVCCYLPQAFVNSAWQLILLQALSGLAIGGMIPSINALMNFFFNDSIGFFIDNFARSDSYKVDGLFRGYAINYPESTDSVTF